MGPVYNKYNNDYKNNYMSAHTNIILSMKFTVQ